MRVVCIGGGPGGLYFALLMKRADPRHQVTVIERQGPDDTSGFGVVFSDAAMAAVATADPQAYEEMARHLVHWDNIEVHCPDRAFDPGADGSFPGTVIISTGHRFSGISRPTLLRVLQGQARAAGVELLFGQDIAHDALSVDSSWAADLIVAADGADSRVRRLLEDRIATTTTPGSNRFIWLGTTRPFPAFTFCFRHTGHGLWRVHAYQYAPGQSAFIVECREECWHAAGMDAAAEAQTADFLERLFARELDGHRLVTNGSVWRQFHTVRAQPWSAGHVVLLGDAAHTAHFSVGSGTRMAMEDAVALRDALVAQLGSREAPRTQIRRDVVSALRAYETARRPQVESLQRAAQASLEWFEHTERYVGHDATAAAHPAARPAILEPIQFTFSLLTRSLRITHEDLRVRDPELLARVNASVVAAAEHQTGVAIMKPPTASVSTHGQSTVPPPMFTPFRLRDLVILNRVAVSPMCQYVADDGTVGDWHLVHLGSRAIGGAGLVIAEMTAVSREARISVGCAGLYKDEHLPAWTRIVDFVHRETPAKIGVQLGHAGRKGSTKLPWEGDNEPLDAGGWPVTSASSLPYFPDRSPVPREMTRADMDAAIADFVQATTLADRAGFDLLEIHMAHGYLLASFISPLTNTRVDDYGGGLANRLRFPLQVFDACRRVWPQRKPMSARISAVDWVRGGMGPDDAVEVVRLLKAHDCDIVDVSTGQTVPDSQPEHGRLFQTPLADRIRFDAGIPTMAVGGISSHGDVNTIIAAGRADLCLLGRAHLFDPYWTRHAAWMQGYALPWPEPYQSVEHYNPRFDFLL